MKIVEIDLTPEEYCSETMRKAAVARKMGLRVEDVGHVEVLRRSLDSRRGIRYHTTAEIYRTDEIYETPLHKGHYQDCTHAPRVVIVGAGPAGLFAALHALEVGLKPVVLDRGKTVEERKYDIAKITREQQVNPDSNWCFGEGGAGTYSDGKLYTRSNKRGNIGAVLEKFIEHGADPAIKIDAHAHIGTDRLSSIISRMRETIIGHGGEMHFGTRVADITSQGVVDSEGNLYEGKAVVLATGHSARDIYELFAHKGWALEQKPFALGVRVEHPQDLINKIQYHLNPQNRRMMDFLPPAAYALTTQAEGHGVFSFCMCPGGIIVPAATGKEQQVVNGMSNSKRNSPFANSGIAVTVAPQDVPQYAAMGPLGLMRFQQDVERKMFEAGGKSISAPTQRLTDFYEGRLSKVLNKTNYMGQVTSAPLHELLPDFVVRCLQQGFRQFDQKMRGFYTQEASVLAVESRTSSPVRIPRGKDYRHFQLGNVYPCGEGAGYAGGIVSSAMDGMNVIDAIAKQ